jgi:hypothetical protein
MHIVWHSGAMANPAAVSEASIRAALIAHLQRELPAGALVIEELGVEHGSARVDVAAVSDELAGFEIKSDLDTLDRLARQMHAYHRVFDTVTLVTTPTYLDQAEQLLPSWWGLWEATQSETGTRLRIRRPATRHLRQSPESVAGMLWRDEAYEFLIEQCGPVVKARAPRHAIYEALARSLPMDAIRERVALNLRQRTKLQPRSVVAGRQLPLGEDEMVISGITTPRREVA